MRAIVFGQSGIEKTQYLQQVQAVAQDSGKRFELLNLGDFMQDLDPDHRNPQLFPSLPLSEQSLLREQGVRNVLAYADTRPTQDLVLIAHAVFKTATGLVPAAVSELLVYYKPDLVIVLIDDFHYIHRRLHDTPFADLSLSAILEWRDAELTAARTAARQILSERKGLWPFFVVARGHSPRLICSLLYELQTRRRIYASFGITGATQTQGARVREFMAQLARDFIVFDPFKIVEGQLLASAEASLTAAAANLPPVSGLVLAGERLLAAAHKASTSLPDTLKLRPQLNTTQLLTILTTFAHQPSADDRLRREDNPSATLFEPYEFDLHELHSIRASVEGQIISRDYQLIDQAELVCALIPWDNQRDRPTVSAGSQSELTYARFRGLPRFVVCEGHHERLSVWIRQHATELFGSTQQLHDYLRTWRP